MSYTHQEKEKAYQKAYRERQTAEQKAKRKAYMIAYRERNREALKAKATAYRDLNRDAIRERERKRVRKPIGPEQRKAYDERTKQKYRSLYNSLKDGMKCMNPKCGWQGEFTPWMLDFHHVEPSEKVKSVSQLVGRPKLLEAEIAKCTVLCANCHREVTYGNLDDSGLPRCKMQEQRST